MHLAASDFLLKYFFSWTAIYFFEPFLQIFEYSILTIKEFRKNQNKR